jgi:hypothetical protein
MFAWKSQKDPETRMRIVRQTRHRAVSVPIAARGFGPKCFPVYMRYETALSRFFFLSTLRAVCSTSRRLRPECLFISQEKERKACRRIVVCVPGQHTFRRNYCNGRMQRSIKGYISLTTSLYRSILRDRSGSVNSKPIRAGPSPEREIYRKEINRFNSSACSRPI